jgi:hypothetical protein
MMGRRKWPRPPAPAGSAPTDGPPPILEGENQLMVGKPLPPPVEPLPPGPPDEIEPLVGENELLKYGSTDWDSPLIPTAEEIAALPRSAGMAFAARCVRRVVPLYRHAWPAAPDHHRAAVERAVRVVEQSAGEAERAAAAFATAEAADAAGRASAGAAFDAARAAARLAGADSLPAAAFAVRGAADALVRAATYRTSLTRQLRRIRRDFDRIAHLAKTNGWTDETPVPADAFGPMWPNRAPDWWPGE